MLTIAIATVLAIAIARILKKMRVDEDSIIGITECIIGISIIIGLFGSISGYKDKIFFEEIELISLEQEGNKFTYTYEETPIISSDEQHIVEYITETIIGNKVKIIEDPLCNKPVLKIYLKNANKSKWTFAILGVEKEYIFYIPQKIET